MKSTLYALIKFTGFLFVVLSLVVPTTGARAQAPWEDVGFSIATPRPDPDLVVVREKAYGAEGVDLTAYGIGTESVDFVQSIYFRFFVDRNSGSYDSFIARVVFPDGVTILGIITDGDELGGPVDDGVATELDAIFGVAPDPDDYSEQNRGFEQLGGDGTSEFVALANGNNIMVFGLNIEEGMDDFRVIVDYGSSFGPDLSFDILSYRIGLLGGAVPERGIRVGDDFNAVVFGSGDFGEAGSVLGIPLTSVVEPTTDGSLPFLPYANIYILRDQTDPDPTLVDGFDVDLALPASDLHSYPTAPMLLAAGITDAADGKIYSVSQEFGLASSMPGISGSVEVTLEVLDGTCIDVTNSPGIDDLFLVRDQAAGDTFIDRLELSGNTFTQHVAVTGSDVTDPVAITDFPDGMLFVVDANGGFATMNVATQAVVTGSVTLPEGNWVDATRRGDLVYVLRELPGGVHTIDIFNPVMGTISTFGMVDVPHTDSPAAITDGPHDNLYVVSQAPDVPATVAEIDPDIMAIVHLYDFLHFPGSNVSVTNLDLVVSSAPGSGGLPVRVNLMTAATPNPFNPMVTISYALERDSQVRVAIYDIQGRMVRTIFNGPQGIGEQSVTWDGTDRTGRDMPSGTYLYRVDTGLSAGMGKITLAK
jgi:hypothetical protein